MHTKYSANLQIYARFLQILIIAPQQQSTLRSYLHSMSIPTHYINTRSAIRADVRITSDVRPAGNRAG